MISQTFLNRYRKEVEQASRDARNYIQAITDAYRIAYPEASVAEVRNYTLDAINDAVNVFGGQSMLIANNFFVEIARDAGVDVETELYNTFDPSKAEDKVRYLAKSIVEDEIETFNGKVRDLTAFYVKREAFENLYRNCKKNGVRYARVPSGRETCAFCFMLASRGFVYWSEEDAGGAGHKYHSNCDCIIVPGFHKDSGLDEDAQIEGYKPSELRERYRKCYDAINPDGFWSDVYDRYKNSGTDDTWQKYKTKELVKEIRTRDWEWLWTDKPADVKYFKEREKLTEDEKNAVDVLRSNGFKVVVNEQDDSKPSNIDFKINNKFVEHKNVTSDSSVSSQINRGRRQFYRTKNSPVTLIFTDNGSRISDEEIIKSIKSRIHKDEEWMVVYGDRILKIKG